MSFAHPASSVAGSAVQLACASCRTPNRGFSSPPRLENIKEKSPYLRTGSSLNDGGEGGLIRFAHPAGSVAGSAVQLACASCRTPHRGFSSPPRLENIQIKMPSY